MKMKINRKSAIRAGAVLVVALAAGHLAQTMNAGRGAPDPAKPKAIEQVSAGPDAAAAPAVADPVLPAAASLTGAAPAAPAIAAPVPEAPVLAALPEVPGAVAPEPLVPAFPIKDAPLDEAATTPQPQPQPADAPPQEMADLGTAADPGPAMPQAPAVAAKDCPLDMSVSVSPQAMIAVTISAPCRGNERVVLRHAGLAVAESLSAEGSLSLDLPALNTKGEVSALFADAEVLRGAVAVPDAALVHRFAVQWMADDAFQLHAFENGADYGQPGAVSADVPVSPNGGYLVSLGDPTLDLPMLAQVYTWPSDTRIPAEISIESAVTDLTCGRELLGETIQALNGAVSVTDLTLAMPECDAIGDILVLKNPDQGVTLAAN